MPRSLRARVVIGFVLWTLGLFALAHVVAAALMTRFPGAVHITHGILVFLSAVLCMALGFSQVRSGLSPFQQLRDRLGTVRDGRARQIEGTYPNEVQPLVTELNALLDHRDSLVRRALAKAGDLAHGLKTPLAVLAQEAERADAAGHHELSATLKQQIDRMQRQLDYHLAHARAAAAGATAGVRCAVAESVDALTRTLAQLHRGRGLALTSHVPADHVVRARREDLDEMLGNLIDNACKWAKSSVTVTSSIERGSVVVTVDDDGPGIQASLREKVLQRGIRADEAAPGTGLGLAIVRDLAELHGGTVVLSESAAGGLRARLSLPVWIVDAG
jgi:signal transduction histidine kinase